MRRHDVVVLCRFNLWVRESCRRQGLSGAVRCEPGQLQPVVDSLVYSARVDGLTPYTRYEFLLGVDNSAGSLQQPVTTAATTLPAGIDYCLLLSIISV